MHKNQKGITLVGLIITIILMLILAGITIHMVTNIVQRARIEDIKTNMLAIQGRARIIADKYDFGGEDDLAGRTSTELGISVPPGIGLEHNEEGNLVYRIFFQEDLEELGLNITINREGEFYIVDYNTLEVFYSLGVEGKHSLSEIRYL